MLLSSSRYHRQVFCVARPAKHSWPNLSGQQHWCLAGGLLCGQCGVYDALWQSWFHDWKALYFNHNQQCMISMCRLGVKQLLKFIIWNCKGNDSTKKNKTGIVTLSELLPSCIQSMCYRCGSSCFSALLFGGPFFMLLTSSSWWKHRQESGALEPVIYLDSLSPQHLSPQQTPVDPLL